LFVGVLFRAGSWLGRPAFVSPAATVLLPRVTLSSIVAAYTGDLAHGPVEQMPGLRPAVEDHEFWGNWARNIFLVVVVAELVALALRNSPTARDARLNCNTTG